MSVKQIEIHVPGSDLTATVGITAGKTARDVLNEVGLPDGYFLFPVGGNTFYQPTDVVDELEDGATLHAAPWVEVG